jgi:hypothetical protein
MSKALILLVYSTERATAMHTYTIDPHVSSVPYALLGWITIMHAIDADQQSPTRKPCRVYTITEYMEIWT